MSRLRLLGSLPQRYFSRFTLRVILSIAILLLGAFALRSAYVAAQSASADSSYSAFSGAYVVTCNHDKSIAAYGSGNLIYTSASGRPSECASGTGYLGLPVASYNNITVYCVGKSCNGWFKGYDSDGVGVYLPFGSCDTARCIPLKITQICPGCGKLPINSFNAAPAPPSN